MGRHATVAGRQAASAAIRGKVFTKLARELMVAARNGSDPSTNARLRLAMDKAREQNMPKDNIERAVKKGAGELEGLSFEEVTYEGYGPGGSAIMVECLTDNRNRTNPEIRRIFQKSGGNMAEMGAVGWMFKKQGLIYVSAEGVSEEKVMEVALEAGADDVVTQTDSYTIHTEVSAFALVRDAIAAANFAIQKSGLELISETTVKLTGDAAKQAIDLLTKLEDQDDTQNVFHNFDIDDAEWEQFLA